VHYAEHELERRVADTYATRSTATLKNSLYDSYKMAIRWASDRIGEQGVIAFVTNGSWIDGNVDSGVRACLAEEFSSIWVLNLRGNQRTQGERSRREGGKVFGQGSCAPVAITILVRNPNAAHAGCRILYRDIGDYLKREEKLAVLRNAGSIAGIDDWREITPDRHDDWLGQRAAAFQALYPMGSKAAKAGKSDEVIFRLYSRGLATSRDAYIYNFSRDACAENARKMVGDYMGAMQTRQEHPECSVDDAVGLHSRYVRWDRELKNNLRRGRSVQYSVANIWVTQYRPFVKQHCYVEYSLVNNKYKQDSIFPPSESKLARLLAQGEPNRAICVPGVGATRAFSALMVDRMPDLHCVSFGQCFPRYRYEPRGLFDDALVRVDNMTDTALATFRERYRDDSISKDKIFDYVYGVLHAPAYRKRFANDLAKALPRVPVALDFDAFAAAGERLAELHLGYEYCPEHPLEVVPAVPGKLRTRHYRLGDGAMRFDGDDKRVLIVNDHVRLPGIPQEAHGYVVNGRTPLEWFMDRYRVTRDGESGNLNDPNGWFAKPEDLIVAIRRVVHVSVETARIVAGLADPFDEEAS